MVLFFMKKIAWLFLGTVLLLSFLISCDTANSDILSETKIMFDIYSSKQNSDETLGNTGYKPDDEPEISNQTSQIYDINSPKEFLKSDPSKGADYNDAIEAYNEFLRGEIDAAEKDNYDSKMGLCYKLGFDNISYAIFDLNGDGIPELLTSWTYYMIFSYKDNNVVFWLTAGNGRHEPVKFLEDGTIFYEYHKADMIYSFVRYYIKFGLNGNISEVTFAIRPEPENQYIFNWNEVSENEWNALTEEYSNLAKKTALIEWQPYWTEP